MWQIDNRTPFAAAGTWVRDRDGREIWVVAVKATFTVDPGGIVKVAMRQEPVFVGPRHRGEPGKSSLLGESDLVLTKRTTDIIVNGLALAPRGRAVESMTVGVRVGPVAKQLRVVGDRRWRLGRPGAAQPFVEMPIVYERAFGGADADGGEWEPRNPVGTGFAARREQLDASPPPNVEYADDTVGSWRARPRPAGFGAIESHWQPRARWGGTYDKRWISTRLPLPPADFDDRWFQCAPVDQQAPKYLDGGEPVVLRGFSADGDQSFELPRCAPTFETRFFTGAPEKHVARLHSVVLEPPAFSLVFHTALPCHQRCASLERTVVACDWARIAIWLPDAAADSQAL